MEGKNIWSTGEIKNGDGKGEKYKKKENIQSAEEKKNREGKENDENIWRRKIFSAEEEVEIFLSEVYPTLKSFRLCK